MPHRRNALTVAKAVEMVNIAEGHGAMSGVRKRHRSVGTKATFAGRRGEQKYQDVAVAETEVYSDVPLVRLVNGIAQNTSINGRIANRAWITGLKFNFQIHAVPFIAVTAVDPIEIRCLVVVDKQANGATLSLGDLLNNGGTPSERWKAFPRVEFKRRFRILKDTLMTINPTDSPTAFNRQVTKKVSLTFKRPIVTEYTATGSGISAIESNSIHVIFISNNITDASNLGAAIYFNYRTTWSG